MIKLNHFLHCLQGWNYILVVVPLQKALNTVIPFCLRQCLGILLGCFWQSSKNGNVSNQLESPFCVLTFLGTLLHNIIFFHFSLDCYQIRLRTEQMGFFETKYRFHGRRNIDFHQFQNVHLFFVVSLHAIFSDVLGANSNSETPSRKMSELFVA